VSGQLQALTHFTRGDCTLGTNWIGWVNPAQPVWGIGRSENSWSYRDSNSDPSVVQLVATRYIDYAAAAVNDNSKIIIIIVIFQCHIETCLVYPTGTEASSKIVKLIDDGKFWASCSLSTLWRRLEFAEVKSSGILNSGRRWREWSTSPSGRLIPIETLTAGYWIYARSHSRSGYEVKDNNSFLDGSVRHPSISQSHRANQASR
jgi:hypothetical protein